MEETTPQNINLHIDEGMARIDREMVEIERRTPRFDDNPLSITGIRPLTDLGNAERLVDLWGNNIRYCHPTSTWYIWDGRRWNPDCEGKIQALAAETVRTIYSRAGQLERDEDRHRLAKFALASETGPRLKTMVELAKSRSGIPVLPSNLDGDPWKLNVLNGTIDLHTGNLLSHKEEDLITKLAPVKYDPESTSELWDKFLDDVTGGDPEFRSYIARALGASLLGVLCGEECLFFIYGSTATGKSTLLEAIKATLGEYSCTADFSTFLAGRKGSIRSDVARLIGSRIVISSETEDGSKLAEGLIKQYTGGDTISARPLYREEIEIKQRGMLWLVSNNRPKADAGDDALWRRIRVLPFEHTIPEEKRDPNVKRVLSRPEKSGSAILAFAVKGCLEWQQKGLNPPSCIQHATDDYKQAVNPVSHFVNERCDLGPNLTCTSADLWEAYTRWAADSGIRFALIRQAFGQNLKALGFESLRQGTDRVRGYQGIDLKSSENSF